MSSALLQVEGLTVGFSNPQKSYGLAVDRVSFTVNAGETLCLVGESGCGKSLSALSILRLLPETASLMGGYAFFQGQDLFSLSAQELLAVRGNGIGMIFQDPMASLNPVLTIGKQVAEALRQHKGYSARQGMEAAIGLLQAVGIPEPEKRIHEYPHQLSGGMRQRVMIAQAISCEPQLIIADEPTTALDVTVQRQILQLLQHFCKIAGRGLLLISHDLAVVAASADAVAVMYAGMIVEQGRAKDVLQNPLHPYTQGLLQSRVGLLHESMESLEKTLFFEEKQKSSATKGLYSEPSNVKKPATSQDRSAKSQSTSVVDQNHAGTELAKPVEQHRSCSGAGTRQLQVIPGVVPSIWDKPTGCLFHPRCDKAMARCQCEQPYFYTKISKEKEHAARCFLLDG